MFMENWKTSRAKNTEGARGERNEMKRPELVSKMLASRARNKALRLEN
jgi:hypothetical protein